MSTRAGSVNSQKESDFGLSAVGRNKTQVLSVAHIASDIDHDKHALCEILDHIMSDTANHETRCQPLTDDGGGDKEI